MANRGETRLGLGSDDRYNATVAQGRSPVRLVVALAIAALLAVFLLYTSIAGGGTPSLAPSELNGRTDRVALAGKVVGPVRNTSRRSWRFTLRDIEGPGSVRVLYRDSLPAQFKVGRHITLDGRLRSGVFVGVPGSLLTKCPSKWTDEKTPAA